MKHFERILYPLTSIISYIRMVNYCSPHYFVRSSFIHSFKKMKWMYSVIFILFFFFFSWRGRSRSLVWNVRVKFATKTLLPWENGHLLPFKSRARMRSVRGAERTVDTIPFLVLLKSVLIFHRQGFYCTDSIHENRLTILFFEYKCS